MEIKGQNVLVTGGAGFIGSHLVEAYLSNDAKNVVIYDDFSTGTWDNLKHIKDNRLKVVEGSVLDFTKLNDTVKQGNIDIIDHLAAELEVYTGIKDSEKDARINILGTLNVLNVALRNNVKRLLFASSGAVYGEAKYIPIDENHPLEPHWPYGVSKLSAERYVLQYHKLFGLKTTAFRYGIVYGPREWYGRVLTMFMKRIFLENSPPVVFGDGSQLRDFVHVRDVAKAHIYAVENEKAIGEVFNIGSGNGTSIKKLAETILEISGKKLEIIYDDPEEGTASQHQPERIRLKGELKNFVLSINKANRLLNWQPTVKLQDGLKEEIDWLLRNKSRWNTKPRV